MTIGRGFVRWQECTWTEEVCEHRWWERLADWFDGIDHAERWHRLAFCGAWRMVKGGGG